MVGRTTESAKVTAATAQATSPRSSTTARERAAAAWPAVKAAPSRPWARVTTSTKIATALICGTHLAVLAGVWGRGHLAAAGAIFVVSALLSVAASIDHVAHRIPNRLLRWAAGTLWVTAAIGGTDTFERIALGVVLGTLPLLILLLTRGIGMGDVKMAAVVGGAAGIVHPLAAIGAVFAMALGSGTYGIVTKQSRVALGPWLWGGLVVSTSVAAVVVQMVGHTP